MLKYSIGPKIVALLARLGFIEHYLMEAQCLAFLLLYMSHVGTGSLCQGETNPGWVL